ncbi:MAG TPA: IS110 family transposase [Candidatus Acidoferrales bacterium]|jgi:transposase|nr:IS110 family transposase [Candidatus Acidoferrales bacterium]
MQIIGVDLHARQQSVSMVETESGELIEKTLLHEGNQVREFYAGLAGPALVGLEATGSMLWFLRLLEEFGIDYRVGHPVAIRKAELRKQKHDRRDAALIRRLLEEDRFPTIWLPSAEQRDLRTLLMHRHHLVRMRTMAKNGLQSLALSQGLRRGTALWSQAGQQELESLLLAEYATMRREQLQHMVRDLSEQIQLLNQTVREHAERRTVARRLMSHPGVGPITALATEVFLGDARRFGDAKAVASYVGMIPSEYSSGGRQRTGKLSKQGKAMRASRAIGRSSYQETLRLSPRFPSE